MTAYADGHNRAGQLLAEVDATGADFTARLCRALLTVTADPGDNVDYDRGFRSRLRAEAADGLALTYSEIRGHVLDAAPTFLDDATTDYLTEACADCAPLDVDTIAYVVLRYGP